MNHLPMNNSWPKLLDYLYQTCQAFPRSALGKSKAQVQAKRARAINPGLVAEGIHLPVEGVPLGELRVDLIACCLDSRVSRQYVNQAAWRIFDAGLNRRIV